MTTTIERVMPTAAPAARFIGQGTAVEQSRAVAEVQGAIVVAQQCPRNIQAALQQMRDSCAQPYLAEKAFFRYSRGGKQITGPSVHLARDLARVWGNFQYGIKELRRDDVAGESEMLAFAWDVQANTRNESTFIVPHQRDKDGTTVQLTQNRDIYENNANAGARRVRECILAVLPPWFVEEAKQLCQATNRDGGGKPLAHRIADAISGFAALGVTVDRIENKLGRASSAWTGDDVATLGVIYRSIGAGETTIGDEFPTDTAVTVSEIRSVAKQKPETKAKTTDEVPSQHQAAAAEEPPAALAEDAPAQKFSADSEKAPATQQQMKKVHTLLSACRVTDREQRLDTLSLIIGQRITSSTDLTRAEASGVIELLERITKDENPVAALDLVLAELANQDAEEAP